MIYQSLFGIFLILSLVGCGPNVQDGVKAYEAKNYDAALAILQKNQTDRIALYYLYEMALNGDGQPKNLPKALEYLKKSADQDYPEAMADYGAQLMSKYSDMVKEDPEKGLIYLTKAIDAGNLNAHASLGNYLIQEKNNAPLGLFHLHAAESTWQGKLGLAWFYERGRYGIKPDPNKVFQYRRLLYDSKSTPARVLIHNRFDLAELYYYGYGVQKNYETAIKLLEPEINRDENIKSLYAWMLYRGEGIVADKNRAVQLWMKTIDKSDSYFFSHYQDAGLSLAYHSGSGVESNKIKALFYLKKIAPANAGDYLKTLLYSQGIAGEDCKSYLLTDSTKRPVDRYKSLAGETHRSHARCLFEKMKMARKNKKAPNANLDFDETEIFYSIDYAKLLGDPLIHKLEVEFKSWRNYEGVFIGMTQDQVRASKWGRPRDINRTTNSSGSTEQWVYGNGNYLYFRNGLLETIQN